MRIATLSLTLGTSRLGEQLDEPTSTELADAILASDLGHVDTSNNYAAGRSERYLGQAIRRRGGLPPNTLIYSKADRDPETGAFDAERVYRSCDESLTRLGVDRLPVYSLHDPQGTAFADTMGPGGAVEALIDLRDQGVIGAVGIAAGPRDLVLDYVRTDVFDAVLSHNRFTLVDQSASAIFEEARKRGMVTFNAAPFGGGVLADPSKESYAYRPLSSPRAAFIAQLADTARSFAVDLGAAALHFSLRSDLIDSTVVGITSMERLEQLADLAATVVPEEFFTAVERLGRPPENDDD